MNIISTHKRLAKALGATALLAAALAPSLAFAVVEQQPESATVGQAITDTAISTKLRAKLLADERIKKSDITVHTANRVVSLSGKVPDAAVKAAALDIATSQEGVVSVNNSLQVASVPPTFGEKVSTGATKTGHAVEHAADKTGEVITDSYITSKIKSQLLAAKGVSSAGIEVTTVDGVVTLAGHVPRSIELTRAIAIAKKTKGVKSVEAAGLEVAAE
jgi:hyperosmotically inducible protein